MEKIKQHVFGKDTFYIGNLDGEHLWLEAPTWDCGWYWGFGYVETYTRPMHPHLSKNIVSHTHFDGRFLGKNYDVFIDELDSPLSESEKWEILEILRTAYTLKETAVVFGRGGSHIANNPCKDLLKKDSYVEEINKVLLPALFEKLEAILTPSNT